MPPSSVCNVGFVEQTCRGPLLWGKALNTLLQSSVLPVQDCICSQTPCALSVDHPPMNQILRRRHETEVSRFWTLVLSLSRQGSSGSLLKGLFTAGPGGSTCECLRCMNLIIVHVRADVCFFCPNAPCLNLKVLKSRATLSCRTTSLHV